MVEAMSTTNDERRDFGIMARFNASMCEHLEGDQFLAAFGLDPRLLLGTGLAPAERDRVRRDTWNRIADIVDPTCHLVGTTSEDDLFDGLTIFRHELSCGHTCETVWLEPPAYCDECGARVVVDDGDR